MAIKQGDKVTVRCPSERRYPNFHRAFHGKPGHVVGVSKFHFDERGLPIYLEVNLANAGDAEKQTIVVERNWLAAA